MDEPSRTSALLLSSLRAALSLGQDALLALLPLLPEGASARLHLWAPVFASLARLSSLLRDLARALTPLLINGAIEQQTLEQLWRDVSAEGQSMLAQLPEAERWLDGLEVIDDWASHVMADEHGMSLISSLLSRLESKVNTWVVQIIEAMMSPEAEDHATTWLERLTWLERVAQRLLDEIILPRVFAATDRPAP